MALINEESHEKHLLKGSEILSWGTVKEIDGQPINPDQIYLYRYPLFMVQNNARRMKKAFLKHGEKGITHFMKQNLATVEANQN